MNQTLYAQDQAGNRHRVIQRPAEPGASGNDSSGGAARLVYTLSDGTPVRRVDNDTFQIISTGAYISTVQE